MESSRLSEVVGFLPPFLTLSALVCRVGAPENPWAAWWTIQHKAVAHRGGTT
jgi:hypothetical protein